MGQRVQTFLITPNVYKKVAKWLFRGRSKTEVLAKYKALAQKNPSVPIPHHDTEDDMEMDFVELEKAFGDENYTIIAHYHHCLYHASAVALAYRVLDFCQKSEFVYNIFHPKHWAMKHYVDLRTIPRFLKNIESLLSLHNYYDMADKINAEKGWMPCNFLNVDTPYILDEFDRYQNDGGVIIIDTIQQKYAFINIRNPDYYDTWDAMQYYEWGCPQERSYYEELAGRNRYDEDYIDQRWELAKKGYGFVVEYFKDLEVMTCQEVAMYFPMMRRKLLRPEELLLINKPEIELFTHYEREENDNTSS